MPRSLPAMRPFRLAILALCAAAALASAQTNPTLRFGQPSPAAMNGVWNGVDLERRSNCATPQNNGNRGTYAQFDIFADAAGNVTIDQAGITGLNCTYSGRQQVADGRPRIAGTLSCSDGKRGDFQTTAIETNAVSLDIRMSIQLTGSERCTIEAILSMARLPP